MLEHYRIHIGCCGFSYRDWKGTFYPSNISDREMILYYARHFDVVELNYSFYSIPHPYTAKSFLEKVPRLRFAVKANRTFTHERGYTTELRDKFVRAIEPYIEADRFIALLFQFPQSFHLCAENMDYLYKLSKDFEGIDKVLELRNRSFNSKPFFKEVEAMGFSLVNTDAPKVKGILTGPWMSVGTINYIRLHGRNEEKWFEHKEAYERYDYLYTEEELKDLKGKIRKIYKGKDTYVFFNNHYRGKGALNALQLKEMFGEEVKIPAGLRSTFTKKLWE